jgi:hypothetical protein
LRNSLIVIAIIIAVIISGSIGYAVGTGNTFTTTQPTTLTMTETTTQYFTTTSIESSASSGCTTSSCLCPDSFNIGDALQTSTNHSATLCLRYYYYSSTPQTFSASELLQIKGYGAQGSGFDSSANFTISASINNFTIGGPDNQSEGTLVVFSISSKLGASGSYSLDLFGYVLPNLEQCATEFTLVAGSGVPDYRSLNGGCIVVSTTSTNNATTPYPYPDGVLAVQVLGLSGNVTGG